MASSLKNFSDWQKFLIMHFQFLLSWWRSQGRSRCENETYSFDLRRNITTVLIYSTYQHTSRLRCTAEFFVIFLASQQQLIYNKV